MITADALTGALVREARESLKLSRAQFSEVAGFAGRSVARLANIEMKDSWKPGDRERVLAALVHLGYATLAATNADAPAAASVAPPEPAQLPDVVPIDGETVDAVAADAWPVVLTEREPAAAPAPAPPRTLTIPSDAYPISNGEQQTWKRCRRKWWLTWYLQRRLRNRIFTDVRATGDRTHRALAAWYVPEGQPRVDPRDALERAIVEDWTLVVAHAEAAGVTEDKVSELAVEFNAAANLERAMIEGYVEWLAETGEDADLRVIASETPLATPVFEVDVSYPHDVRRDPRSVVAIGLLDARVLRVTDGVRLFEDHKTVGDLKSPVVTLPQNEQMLHYHLLEWLTTPEGEARCDGALYNMLRRVKRTTQAKPPFFDRVEVRHNQFELQSYRTRLVATTRDVLRAIDALNRGESHLTVAYPTPRDDCRWDCDFFAVCNMLDDGSAGAFDLIDRLYEVADPRDRYTKRGDR